MGIEDTASITGLSESESKIASVMMFMTPIQFPSMTTTTTMSMSGNQLASVLAGIAFYYLSYVEFSSTGIFLQNNDGGAEIPVTNDYGSSMKDAIQLAIPMTLNNLAGGIAGGTAGE